MAPEGRLSVPNAEATVSSVQRAAGDRPKQATVDEDRGDAGGK